MASNKREPSASYKNFGEMFAGVSSSPATSSARKAAWSSWWSWMKGGAGVWRVMGAFGKGLYSGGVFQSRCGDPLSYRGLQS